MPSPSEVTIKVVADTTQAVEALTQLLACIDHVIETYQALPAELRASIEAGALDQPEGVTQ